MSISSSGSLYVTLTPEQVEHGNSVGLARAFSAASQGRRDFRFDPDQDNVRIMKVATLAEVATCAALGEEFDSAVMGPNEQYPHFDLRVRGIKFDVKYTDYSSGQLMIRNLYRDVNFILVRGLCPNYELKGWVYGAAVATAEGDPLLGVWDNPGKARCWTVPESRLLPATSLLLEAVA
jgi:hypothetical protein